MTDSKPFYQSKGVWGGVLTVLLGLGQAVGIAPNPDLVMGVATAFAGIFATYGRIAAASKIG